MISDLRVPCRSRATGLRGPLAASFHQVDWSFGDSHVQAPHDIHPYPARYIAEIPAAALGLVPDLPGDVLDPFCGAGTTVVEAVRAGRRATGIDLNPIATLITRAKTHRWDAGDDRRLEAVAFDLRQAGLKGDQDALAEARDRIPRLDHWFAPESQLVLAGATRYARSIEDDRWRDFVSVAISATIVRLSRQESDTRYAAVDRAPTTEAAVRAIDLSLSKVAAQLRAFAPSHSGAATVITTGDASAVGEVTPASFAACIFSPPYPNAYEYWLYHKYRMYWLGFDPVDVRSSEWGARPHYSGGGSSTIETFRSQIRPIMSGVLRALRSGGICVVVVGDSRIKGEMFNNAELFESLASEAGFQILGHAHRDIRSSRKSFNPANARATDEHVLLFGKP